MHRHRLSLGIILPLLDLLLWVLLIVAPTVRNIVRLHDLALGTGVAHVEMGEFVAEIPQSQYFAFALNTATIPYAQSITALNLPGDAVQLLISLPTRQHSRWHPASLTLYAWEAAAFPLFCLPFWWLAGRAIDALLGRRRLDRRLLLAGTLGCLACLALLLALRFGMPAAAQAEAVPWLFPGLAVWSVVFAIFPMAGLRQMRAARRRETA